MKKILIALAAILILLQFYRPAKNRDDQKQGENAIERHYGLPQRVSAILKTSCYDCHSNNSNYPWYNNIQPIGIWLDKHIRDGKRHLNFDEFNSYTIERKRKKLNEIVETIDNNEMPLYSYTLIHKETKLTEEDKKEITDWVNTTLGNL